MTRANTWFLWRPFLVAGAVLIVWYGVWRAGAGAMREALAEFSAREARTGGAVTHAPMRAKGFPFFLRGEIGDFSIARGKYRVDADTLYLHASPLAPARLVLSAAPTLTLSTPDGAWTLRTEGARASIEATDAGWLFKAEAAALDAVKKDTAVKTGRGVINISPDPKSAGAYAISFRVIDAAVATARGKTVIARLDAMLTAEREPRRLVLHGVDAEIGLARARIRGALAADAQGFLAGDIGASVDNPAALAEALRILGAVKPDDARAVEAGLALVAVAGGGRIEAPLTFVDGETRLAGVKIARAPRVGQP